MEQFMIGIIAVVAVFGMMLVNARKNRSTETRKVIAAKPKRVLTEREKASCAEILKLSSTTYIKLTPVCKDVGIFDCKLGGIPYLPKDFEYPYNLDPESGGKPLKLLCQINFSKLPKLDGFPQSGILQFYIAFDDGDSVNGLDFEDPTEQAAWRVVYHKDIDENENNLQQPPVLDSEKDIYFPLRGEFGLSAELASMPISSMDFRWNEFVENSFKTTELYQKLTSKYTDDEIEETLWEKSCEFGFKIGGYPAFAQYDVRDIAHRDDYSVLLLQLDSWYEKNGRGMMWGDTGVANFFINPDNLAKADFSDVLYNWDCY